MPLNSHEERLVQSFVTPTKRDRYLQLLGNPRRRKKALDTLPHSIDFDDKFATELPSKTDVLSLLRTRGAPEQCYVIAQLPQYDGQIMPLMDALELSESISRGYLISCLPGRLAYYCGEDGERRILLEKPKPT